MFGYGGRGGPSRSTPANVQCQKCLKRDMCSTSVRLYHNPLTVAARHYSYECKASSQERPYVSRPSRTQQLRNPKLVPKLTNDSPDVLEKKKGAADEELAKKEAERKRQRELDSRGNESDGSQPSRKRSPSVDSVSTISTASRSASPPPPRRERSPIPKHRDESPYSDRDDGPSPRRGGHGRSRSPRHDSRSVSRSRSPPRRKPSPRRRDDSHREHRGRDSEGRGRRERDVPPRERSLSPFSRRLALTREMKKE